MMKQLAAFVVERARALGFDLCGVARAEDFAELARLPEWLARGYAGEMQYLSNPRRASPAAAMPGARSVIVCALNYNTAQPLSTESAASVETGRGWISRYAWGEDYHRVLLDKLESLIVELQGAVRTRGDESFEAHAYVDTGPIVERVAAKHAGLGWLAKNTCLINSEAGSWLFLGVILTTLELAPSLGVAEAPPADLCGNCRLCLDACPTGALVEPYVLDARLCISYLTIELRGSIPAELRAPMGRNVFGCDICQDVCPWNHRAPIGVAPEFQPRRVSDNSLVAPKLEFFLNLDESDFREAFRGSPVRRTKWRGLIRNACVAAGNTGLRPGDRHQAEIVQRLKQLAASEDSVIAEHAQWALGRIQ
ncbi:MAG: tRNA epoxyqueuosine(34) reductase QueG [Candidatus Acidiferrales bacterium]